MEKSRDTSPSRESIEKKSSSPRPFFKAETSVSSPEIQEEKREVKDKPSSASEKLAFLQEFVAFVSHDKTDMKCKNEVFYIIYNKDENYFKDGNKSLSHEEVIEKLMCELPDSENKK